MCKRYRQIDRIFLLIAPHERNNTKFWNIQPLWQRAELISIYFFLVSITPLSSFRFAQAHGILLSTSQRTFNTLPCWKISLVYVDTANIPLRVIFWANIIERFIMESKQHWIFLKRRSLFYMKQLKNWLDTKILKDLVYYITSSLAKIEDSKSLASP